MNQPTFKELCSTDERVEFEAQKRFYENAKPNTKFLRYGDIAGICKKSDFAFDNDFQPRLVCPS